MLRRARACAVAAAAVAVAVTACGEPASTDGVASAGIATVSFRLWDQAAADAYRESFDAFNASHRDIHVDVEVVPQDSYASRAASDLADGTMADIFWTTSDAIAAHAHAGDILALDETLGENREEWEASVTGLYTRDGELWAVPQLWEATVLFYNTELVDRAGVDPAALTWDPLAVRDAPPLTQSAPADGEPPEYPPAARTDEPSEPPDTADDDEDPPTPPPAASTDTLRQAVRALTRDAHGTTATEEDFNAAAVVEHGINTDLTAPAVWLPFLAQLGGTPAAGDDLTLAGPEGEATFSYLTELPAVPPDEEPVAGRELFTAGRLALFQSTSADMRYVAERAEPDWGLARVPAGPDGPVSVVDGIGAAANAASADPEATGEVLRWIASTDGQSALASHGVGVPAATGAQDLFLRSWADRGVDASAALGTAEVVTAASGPRAQEVLEAVRPLLAEMFRGEAPVAQALAAAQQAADDALGS